MLRDLFRDAEIELPETFARMTYADAMERYGTDRPDMRYDLSIFDASDAFRPLSQHESPCSTNQLLGRSGAEPTVIGLAGVGASHPSVEREALPHQAFGQRPKPRRRLRVTGPGRVLVGHLAVGEVGTALCVELRRGGRPHGGGGALFQ